MRKRGARRVPCQSSWRGASSIGDRRLRVVLALARLGRAGIRRCHDRRFGHRAARHDARVVAGVRHHADFGLRQLRVGLDPVDERGAARRRREQPLEHDQARALLEDGLERLDRLGIGEREQLALVGETLAERGHQVGGGDDHCGRRHRVSLPCSRRPTVSIMDMCGDDTPRGRSSSISTTRCSITNSAARAALTRVHGIARASSRMAIRRVRAGALAGARGTARRGPGGWAHGGRGPGGAVPAPLRRGGCDDDHERVRSHGGAYRDAYLAARRPVDGRARRARRAQAPRADRRSCPTICSRSSRARCGSAASTRTSTRWSSRRRSASPNPIRRSSRTRSRQLECEAGGGGDGRRLVGGRRRGRARRRDSRDLVQPLAPAGARRVEPACAKSRRSCPMDAIMHAIFPD